MDEKTRQLRDIFMDVAADATVTERQEQSRGSLTSPAATDDRIGTVVEAMRERFEFRTTLPVDALLTVVRGFYAGESDGEIASRIEGEPSPETVARARIDLHLVDDDDLDAPFDLDALRGAPDRPTVELAGALGVSESTIRRYRHVLDVQRDRRAVGDRYREEFDRLLDDRDLQERLTTDLERTGLEDATEGMESNVSF